MSSSELYDRIQPQPSSPDTVDFGQDVMSSIDAISPPMEMTDRGPPRSDQSQLDTENSGQEEMSKDANFSMSPREAKQSAQEHLPKMPVVAPSSSTQDTSAIRLPTDKHTNTHTGSTTGPQLVITLLLHSTDTRHPYIINEKYLKKRNISVADNDPVNLTVYNLKDLIWRDWREEWESRPASPTSIRLIHMGRMLEDKTYLKDSRFSTGETPHVVHMTIKPQEVTDDEDARIAKGGNRDRDGNERTPGCRCNIM